MKILICGDFCPNDRVSRLLNNKQYEEVFGKVKPFIETADYALVNFECPVVINPNAKPIEKLGPNLKCNENAVEAMKYAGFDLVTLANNHFYDYGDLGVSDTFSACEKHGITTVGGGENLTIAERILYKNIDGKIIAFINCCEHEFSIATETTGGANPLNPIRQYYKINEARKSADYVIVIVHGGHEHFHLPSPRMKETYRFFVDAGADVVINHHQHCYSGYEVYRGKTIFYGVGNFCFDWNGKRNSNWNHGYMIELEIIKDKISFQLHPYIQGDEVAGVVIMDEKAKEQFYKNIEILNELITNDMQLNNEWKKWMNETIINYKMALEPYYSRYLAALYVRHLLPSFLSKGKLLVLLNYLQCESHIERTLNMIKNELIKK